MNVDLSSAIDSGLCERFMEGGKSLCLDFDELVELLLALIGNSIDRFDGDFKDKVSSIALK